MTEGFILTPICPHSLTQRPLVLPSHFELVVEVKEPYGKIVLDGQEILDINSKVFIKKAKKPVKLIHRMERNYFEVLREKLNWGDK